MFKTLELLYPKQVVKNEQLKVFDSTEFNQQSQRTHTLQTVTSINHLIIFEVDFGQIQVKHFKTTYLPGHLLSFPSYLYLLVSMVLLYHIYPK